MTLLSSVTNNCSWNDPTKTVVSMGFSRAYKHSVSIVDVPLERSEVQSEPASQPHETLPKTNGDSHEPLIFPCD